MQSSDRPRIGLLLYGLSYPYQNELLIGAHEELAARDAHLFCLSGGGLGLNERGTRAHSVHDLVGHGDLDAIIAATGTFGPGVTEPDLLEFFGRFSPTPCSSIGHALQGVPSIVVDNSESVRELTLHLIDVHGRRRIAFVGPTSGREAEQRHAGYRAALAERGLTPDPALVIDGNFTRDSGIAAVDLLVGPSGPLADAIVAANDWTALGVLEALDRLGIHVPRDVSVVGFDDIDEARFTTPPLTTIVQPIRRLGAEAARTALAQIAGKPAAPLLALPTRVRIRRSCGCFDQSPDVAASSDADRPLRLDPERLAGVLRSAGAEVEATNDWASALVDAFLHDLEHAGSERTLAVLGDVLKAGERAGNVGVWHNLLAVLRSHSFPGWPGPERWFEIERLLQRAHVLVGETAERVQGRRRIDDQNAVLALQDLTSALRTALNRPAIAAALSAHLRGIGIPWCWVALQASRLSAAAAARAVLAVGAERGDLLGGAELTFPAARIVPDQLFPSRRSTVVVNALALDDDTVGYSALELGPYNGALYGALHERLAGALRAAWLLHSVVEQTTRRERAERERLESEVRIATRIQTGILPRTHEVPGLEIATAMLPATEVGGDYFDVLPFADGCWFGIGDVAGHGLPTGLVMVMIQSIVSATTQCRSEASPAEVWKTVNTVLYQNVRERLEQNEHATLTLLRYSNDGRVSFAGAHEDLIVLRAADARVELVSTPGIWAGIVRASPSGVPEGELRLEPGDVLLLYTDGISEARNADGEVFGLARLCHRLEELAGQPVTAMRDGILAAVQSFCAARDDDWSLVVIRRLPS